MSETPKSIPSRKPKKRTRGHIRKRGDKYYIVYSVAGRKKEEVGGATVEQAKRLLTQRLFEADRGFVRSGKPMTFREFIEVWRADHVATQELKPATIRGYDSVIERHLLPAFGDQRMDRITAEHIRRFFKQKQEGTSEKTSRPLSKKTLVNTLRLLNSIFNFAMTIELLVKNPCKGIKLPRAPKREMDFLRPEEVRAFLAAFTDDEMRCLFTTAVMTGIRRGELLGLQWDDIDFGASVIRVRRSISNGEIQLPKTEKSRRAIQVGPELLKTMRAHKLRTGGRSSFVFTTKSGTLLDPDNLVKRVFEPTLLAAGIERHIRFHDLRHTYASILINEGANLKFVSEQLGHASIVITLDRYSHLIAERHDDTVSKFEKLLLSDAAVN
jgi:integrase